MMTAKEYNRLSELLAMLVDNSITDDQINELDVLAKDNVEAEEYCVDWLMNMGFLQRSGLVRMDNDTEIGVETKTSPLSFLPPSLDITTESEQEISAGFDTDLWSALARNEMTAEAVEVELPPDEADLLKPVPIDKSGIGRGSRNISKFSIFTFAVSSAALLLIAVLVWLTPAEPPVVAHLNDSINALWSDTTGDIREGDDLRAGQISLDDGVAEIVMRDGAHVVLQSPVTIELLTSGKVKLLHGSIYAKVPPGSEGFTVETDSAKVVDYGTEFGVEVDQLGRTEAHVFQGKVELSAGSVDADNSKTVELTAGQASAVEGDQVVKVAFQRRRFTCYVPTAYEIAVNKKRPISYWRMQPGAAQSLTNLANDSTVKARYEGDVDLVDGPFASHSDVCSALKFYGDDSYMFIPLVNERRAANEGLKEAKYTFMFWVRPDAIGNQIISTRTNRRGQFHRMIGMTNNGHFNYVYWSQGGAKAVFTLEADTIAQVGQWYHLAVTIEKTGNAQLYVNGRAEGEPVSLQKLSNFYAARFVGQLNVGALPEKIEIEGRESFNGAVADIIEYDRLLSEKEIRSLYNAARGY